MTSRRFLLAALCALACTAPAAFAAEEKVLNIANWAEYIGEDTVHRFEQETGIRVRYDWGNLSPQVMNLMSKLDPGNQFMVPWLGSTVSVGYNLDKVKAALGDEPIPANPFELVFNPKYTSKLKSCGISMLDSAATCSRRR